MTTPFPELLELGNSLEHAVANANARRQRKPGRRRLAVAVVALGLAIPGLAFGAHLLVTPDEVAATLPAGTKMLIGTDPHCTVVVQDVEYRCLLSRPPSPEIADMKGTVEATVDASKHVNGGCRSFESDGLTWECYLGEAAVKQNIIGPDFLGQYAPSPGVG